MERGLTATEQYFLHLISCAVTGKQLKPPFEGSSFARIRALAERQGMLCTVCESLLSLPNIPESKRELLERYRLGAVRRDMINTSLVESITGALEARGIRCMPLKGSVIKFMYPQSYQRSMSDLDFLYEPKDRDEIIQSLAQLDIAFKGEHENHLLFYSASDVDIEFHDRLINPTAPFAAFDDDPWIRSHPLPRRRFIYEMEPEQLYLHSVLHLLQHYVRGGVGARFVVDSVLIRLHYADRLNFNTVRAELDKLGFYRFSQAIDELGNAWCSDTELDETQVLLSRALLEGNMYGSSKQRALNEIISEGGRLKRVLAALFEPAERMRRLYLSLEKHPKLYPLYYPHRIVTRLLAGRKQAVKRIKAGRVDDFRIEEQQLLQSALGLEHIMRNKLRREK